MNIPQKFYDMLEGLSFTDHANFLAIVTYYMEYGVIHDEGKGYALDLFYEIREELDDIMHRRRYAREYRARKKAEKEQALKQKSEITDTSEKTEPSDNSELFECAEKTDSVALPRLSRQERRLLDRMSGRKKPRPKWQQISPQIKRA